MLRLEFVNNIAFFAAFLFALNLLESNESRFDRMTMTRRAC